jgi:hypothetical protein
VSARIKIIPGTQAEGSDSAALAASFHLTNPAPDPFDTPVDRAIVERCLAQIAAWRGPMPPWPAVSDCRPSYVIELQGGGDGDIRKLRAILTRLLRDHDFRCIGAREVCAAPLASPSREVPRRAPAAVRITREGKAWLVVVGAHGWLHGDERSALADARWLASNFGLPIRRRGKREGAS